MQIARNLEDIKNRIRQACLDAGRAVDAARLIAVSKTKPIELIQEAHAAGQVDFGENRVQELRDKHPLLPAVRWHMIGSLQRNKVRFIAPFVHLIHSVDSERLLAEINKQAEKQARQISCLIQLNISEETAKSGLDEQSGRHLLEKLDEYPNVRIHGLMGMASFTDDMEIVRAQFRRLKHAFDDFSSIQHNRIEMKELSMGMSGDFEVAIEEGATMVRIGSAVFGHRY